MARNRILWLVVLIILVFLSACGGNAAIGNPERGQELFMTGSGVIDNLPCIKCHSVDGSDSLGPQLQGISEIAGERVQELSAAEYLEQSILDPSAYLVEGYGNEMGSTWKIFLSEEDVNDLVAFLLTQ
jgi:cytochrome c oxidase subunit 2